MKLKFKIQTFQTNAVESVVDCFASQPLTHGPTYRIDPGHETQINAFEEGIGNAEVVLNESQLLENIRTVQRRQHLSISQSLTDFAHFNNKGSHVPVTAKYKRTVLDATRIHLDIEMETGTGKTYCYIKTIFEMNKRYGWSKFIIMVPSIAIREGVYKSLQITADHFMESYGKKARFFIYNSRRLHELEIFSSDASINVMIINIQAFNARGKDNRRINEELDDFQSRKPIDVIAANRPILILDEPQKMEGKATRAALPRFRPLMILRYSATHRTWHNRIYRLDAVDAYNRKLVKKIAVRGIKTRGFAGTNAYLYLEGINISKKAPVARIELELKLKSGKIKRQLRRLRFGDNLFVVSHELGQYRDGFIISQIDCNTDVVEFTNGLRLKVGEATGNVSDRDTRRIQIREAIRAHLSKEEQLFAQGIKVLSLFFIDEVAKYRDYDRVDEKGEYARIFEEEYEPLKTEHLSELVTACEVYREYVAGTDAAKMHKGYFSIDRKTNRLNNPAEGARTVDSNDVDAYDLILKDKEKLLSFEEPTRFIFSHSALREGWDNPNIFVMCMLKHSDNTISRRQEVGRGLRLCVDQGGNRIDHPALVHEINVLTVVASESYGDFVSGLQKEIAESLSSRPRRASAEYFIGKILQIGRNPIEVTKYMAVGLEYYLIQHGYTDRDKIITQAYHDARKAGNLAELPEDLAEYSEAVFELVDTVFNGAHVDDMFSNGRKTKRNPLNANFEKKKFRELWNRINRKAVYRVDFDSQELIRKCVSALNDKLRVTTLKYTVEAGVQYGELTDDRLRIGSGFQITKSSSEHGAPTHSLVRYDLIGSIARNSVLTRDTSAKILGEIEPDVFDQFKHNPEHFISEVSQIIAGQKAMMLIERLTYDEIEDQFDVDIFTASQTRQDFARATEKLRKHIYDYAITDSDIERKFVQDIDASNEVVVYAKLPRGFFIPTPVGDYNPDWAVSFKEGTVRHIYFVAETKGSLSSLKLREIENKKIACAEKFFETIGQRVTQDCVKYGVVEDFAGLLDIVGRVEKLV